MSAYCLCDTCRKQAGTIELGNYCCLAPGMGRIRFKTRKFIGDNQWPKDMCRHYEPKEAE